MSNFDVAICAAGKPPQCVPPFKAITHAARAAAWTAPCSSTATPAALHHRRLASVGGAQRPLTSHSPPSHARRAAVQQEGSVEEEAGQAPPLVPALKEWAVTCAALGSGEQTILLRKGGIREPTFRAPAADFLLFPTSFHSDAALVKPAAAARYQQALASEPRDLARLPLAYGCRQTGCWLVADGAAALAALDELHVWAPAFLAGRLRWRPAQPLTLMEVRVSQLQPPLEVNNSEELWGCFSWVNVPVPSRGGCAGAQLGPPWGDSRQVLSDDAFREKQALLRAAIASMDSVQAMQL